ncbi:MAG: uracil-DNA glycosylase [Candidatus Omnitrophota bacterium]
MTRPLKEQLHHLSRSARQLLELEKSFERGMLETGPRRRLRDKRQQPLESASWETLRQEVASCTQCVLHRSRTQTVFGEGKLDAALLFVGEAPGMEEDLQGRPFVGQAGKLLTKIIEAIGLKREEVYIANVLKCRPPGNRGPFPEEVRACGSYLEKQIDWIRPRVICSLGKYACLVLVRKEGTISALRGQFYDYRGIPVMPTFHPAYLLRNPSAKRLVWDDMKKIKVALEKSVA